MTDFYIYNNLRRYLPSALLQAIIERIQRKSVLSNAIIVACDTTFSEDLSVGDGLALKNSFRLGCFPKPHLQVMPRSSSYSSLFRGFLSQAIVACIFDIAFSYIRSIVKIRLFSKGFSMGSYLGMRMISKQATPKSNLQYGLLLFTQFNLLRLIHEYNKTLLTFPELAILVANDCSNLEKIEIKCPKLTTVKAHGCLSLNKLALVAPNLRTLDLRDCKKLRDRELAALLEKCLLIEKLYVDGCNLEYPGYGIAPYYPYRYWRNATAPIQEIIKQILSNDPQQLAVLANGKKLDDRSIRAIAKAIEYNNTLVSLDVSNNSFGMMGAQALSQALHTNTTLTHLDIRDNRIEHAMERFVEALRKNTTLQSLSFSESNFMKTELKNRLQAALTHNRSIARQNESASATIPQQEQAPEGHYFASPEEEKENRIRIGLSLDGAGGTRGLMAACLLQEIERKTNRKAHQLFDCIGGSSVGGILALGLTASEDGRTPLVGANKLIKLFTEHAPSIFPGSLFNISGHQYPQKKFEEVLKSYFKEAKFSDVLTRTVAISATDESPRRPFIFDSIHAQKMEQWDFLTRSIASATCIAPLFPPALIPNRLGKNQWTLLDGTKATSNPGFIVYEKIREMNPDLEQCYMLSLGTGFPLPSDMPDDKSAEVKINEVHGDLSKALDPTHYWRLQPKLDKPYKLDSTDAKTLQYYKDKAAEMLQGNAYQALFNLFEKKKGDS